MSVQLARRIFDHAYRYYHASLMLRSVKNPDFKNHAYPAIHLGYLATELFLKSMATESLGRTPRGHNLRKLFLLIAATDQKKLSEEWAGWFEQHTVKLPPDLAKLLPRDTGLASMLKEGEFMLNNSRYQWEATDQGSVFLLIEVPRMLYDCIVIRHPNWAPSFSTTETL
jgi:hypothetical protein